ncbi:MAG TPA: SEC-C metal-binding domain-containing protein [Polyangiaceae bacterium]|nr:SEC-C metal-binding domain-containing protein [Polyangiaceae bacterium]
MAQRVFRLSISPEDVPEVRRVLDFDGRASLAEVNAKIREHYGLLAGNPLYAFFLSGRFWDAKSAYLDPRTDGERADKALLFRLGLTPGKSFAYLLDFGAEQRFTITVTEVRDAAQPLTAPALIESVGDAPAAPIVEAPEQDPPELVELVPLAEEFLDAVDRLEEFADELAAARDAAFPWEADDEADAGALRARPYETVDTAAAVPALLQALASATELVRALAGSLPRFLALDEWLLERSLATQLLELPSLASLCGEHESALALARSLAFVDRELMEGDVAVILARAGRRQEALAQLDANLGRAEDAALVELKAGDTYRTLGDLPAAEAYYRRSLELAKSPMSLYDARLRLVSVLLDTGRAAEAQQVLLQARQAAGEVAAAAALPEVGRNDPCPCGSGKKYKKCHGAG